MGLAAHQSLLQGGWLLELGEDRVSLVALWSDVFLVLCATGLSVHRVRQVLEILQMRRRLDRLDGHVCLLNAILDDLHANEALVVIRYRCHDAESTAFARVRMPWTEGLLGGLDSKLLYLTAVARIPQIDFTILQCPMLILILSELGLPPAPVRGRDKLAASQLPLVLMLGVFLSLDHQLCKINTLPRNFRLLCSLLETRACVLQMVQVIEDVVSPVH